MYENHSILHYRTRHGDLWNWLRITRDGWSWRSPRFSGRSRSLNKAMGSSRERKTCLAPAHFRQRKAMMQLVIAFLSLAIPALAADLPRIRMEPVLRGLNSPVAICDDGTGRLFIAEQRGVIRIAINGQLEARPYLDFSDQVRYGGESGFLCVVFHPQFAKNGRFFVNYTTRKHGPLHTVISEFTAAPDARQADRSTEREVLRFQQPYGNHNGGQLAFGPDGMLYIGSGDGGSLQDPHNNGQQLNTLLGKILRIDVEKNPYGIPQDNPLVGQNGAKGEIWAWGLRNPWRFSFDRKTGDLYAADVGEQKWEEINLIERGKNYGWSGREGRHDFKPERIVGETTDPIKEYSHDLGLSVTGGYVYRGKQFPALEGIYFYADYMSQRIFALRREGGKISLDAELMKTPFSVSSFGEDREGELYLCDYANGRIFRLAGETAR
jgi:glucose/arabinose dehydrogenase